LSWRVRRRLTWLGGLALVAAGVAAIVVFVPSQHAIRVGEKSGRPQLVTHAQRVRLSPADRRAILRTLDRFVPAAVRREDPAAAYDLVTPSMRRGTTRAQWARGRIPVYPYPARGTQFSGWGSLESYQNAVSLDLYLQPQAGHADTGPIVAGVALKRINGRWLVDSFYPKQVFGPVATPPPPVATVAARAPEPGATKGRLSPAWFVVPGVMLGLFVVVGLAFVFASLFRNRRAARRIKLEDARPRTDR
jgi:hypothetical protein